MNSLRVKIDGLLVVFLLETWVSLSFQLLHYNYEIIYKIKFSFTEESLFKNILISILDSFLKRQTLYRVRNANLFHVYTQINSICHLYISSIRQFYLFFGLLMGKSDYEFITRCLLDIGDSSLILKKLVYFENDPLIEIFFGTDLDLV